MYNRTGKRGSEASIRLLGKGRSCFAQLLNLGCLSKAWRIRRRIFSHTQNAYNPRLVEEINEGELAASGDSDNTYTGNGDYINFLD